ncbi:flocculation protein, putative [Candida dubliniensis CD36]|uniref:Flocculation protein, putative n=1 Tax=Candida dubliniensis (strain CD36 / ATCC MYA-646 / CBS 7987 / NCPF 3949 / NRRL Y-17841) TaxID=573826 RepID=B9WCC8_CANDC|nr:flocculation protein, putative [Candida dubliniensis CD36]CAX44050.1 flocculation protein, putative [Candida dubliniensis CD36]
MIMMMNCCYSIFTLIIFILSPIVLTKQVVCLVDNVKVATVDYDTGICPFQLPTAAYPSLSKSSSSSSSSSSSVLVDPFFIFHSLDDYNVQFYYSIVNGHRYTTDIRHGGSIISIAAKLLYEKYTSVYKVHLHKIPKANSTDIIRKRLFLEKSKRMQLSSSSSSSSLLMMMKKDLIDDFIIDIAGSRGIMVDEVILSVVDIDQVTSSTNGGSSSTNSLTRTGFSIPSVTSTKTSNSQTSQTITTTTGSMTTETITTTKIITITSCSNDICHLTTVPGSLITVTATITPGFLTTTYTTYLPINSMETVVSTKIITITSCSDNNHNNNHVCHSTTVLATPSTVTETIDNTITEYVTYCPLTKKQQQYSPSATSIATATAAAAAAAAAAVTTTTTSTSTATITSCWDNTCQTQVTTIEVVGEDTITYYVTHTITSQTSNEAVVTSELISSHYPVSTVAAITTTAEGGAVSGGRGGGYGVVEQLLSLLMIMMMLFV